MNNEEDRQMMKNSIKIRYEHLGIEQGSNDTKNEIVRKMKNENISIEMISKITGLSIEEIKKI